jgi:hypothetical protein
MKRRLTPPINSEDREAEIVLSHMFLLYSNHKFCMNVFTKFMSSWLYTFILELIEMIKLIYIKKNSN